MKTILTMMLLTFGLSVGATPRVITLTVNNNAFYGEIVVTKTVSLATNEVATVLSVSTDELTATLTVDKDGIRSMFNGDTLRAYNQNMKHPIVIVGAASFTLSLRQDQNAGPCRVTLEITPESFPPDKTLILPEGTVGIIHLESSTNLIQWHDEWVNTFANTNQNRFFRIRAERSQ